VNVNDPGMSKYSCFYNLLQSW